MKVFRNIIIALSLAVVILCSIVLGAYGLEVKNNIHMAVAIMGLINFSLMTAFLLFLGDDALSSIRELNNLKKELRDKEEHARLFVEAVKKVACSKMGLSKAAINEVYEDMKNN